ncbi:hypothetical protein H6G97_00195 [Nostoc flagelliforme FACHB-838]|uniref:Transposase n=1 Tax=Nostoc flagelliforme FACHB-838 TaxID=2692904 RepID=A0ABR8DEV6_9NOSO|nr:hypothetical protein [Nostoc flagelliforme]MBD2528054.1 hypothetical protein [Nostoc flagelliforme FACHB-838]
MYKWQEKALNQKRHPRSVLECVQQNCPSCGKPMWSEYNNLRRVRTLKGLVQLLLKRNGYQSDGSGKLPFGKHQPAYS